MDTMKNSKFVTLTWFWAQEHDEYGERKEVGIPCCAIATKSVILMSRSGLLGPGFQSVCEVYWASQGLALPGWHYFSWSGVQVLEVTECPLLWNFEGICHVLLAGLLLVFTYVSFLDLSKRFWLSFLKNLLGRLIGTAFLLALFFLTF